MTEELENVTCLDNGSDSTSLCPGCQWGISPGIDPFFCPRCDSPLTPLSPKRFGGVAIARHIFAEWQKQTLIPLIQIWFHGSLLHKFNAISCSDCVSYMAHSPSSHANRLGGIAIVHHVFRKLLGDRIAPLVTFWFHQTLLAKLQRTAAQHEALARAERSRDSASSEHRATTSTAAATSEALATGLAPRASPGGTEGTQHETQPPNTPRSATAQQQECLAVQESVRGQATTVVVSLAVDPAPKARTEPSSELLSQRVAGLSDFEARSNQRRCNSDQEMMAAREECARRVMEAKAQHLKGEPQLESLYLRASNLPKGSGSQTPPRAALNEELSEQFNEEKARMAALDQETKADMLFRRAANMAALTEQRGTVLQEHSPGDFEQAGGLEYRGTALRELFAVLASQQEDGALGEQQLAQLAAAAGGGMTEGLRAGEDGRVSEEQFVRHFECVLPRGRLGFEREIVGLRLCAKNRKQRARREKSEGSFSHQPWEYRPTPKRTLPREGPTLKKHLV